MKATYENNAEYSIININLKNEKEGEKVMAIALKLISFGDYEMSHFDSEVFMLTNTDANKTIADMKDDYKTAKKG